VTGGRLRRLPPLREQSAFMLTELLTVLLILTIVLGGLTALFISATKSEVDLRQRFEAQQEARIAMDALRREVHCASAIDQTGAAHTVKLTLESGCPSGSGDVTWCTVSAGTSRYQLYRKPGATCDSTGKLYADYLVPDPSGSNPTTECSIPTGPPARLCVFEYVVPTTTSRAKLGVELPVDTDPADARASYKLIDALVLRNSSFLP
jgi:type II secretory pathway pseudopilin PulG